MPIVAVLELRSRLSSAVVGVGQVEKPYHHLTMTFRGV